MPAMLTCTLFAMNYCCFTFTVGTWRTSLWSSFVQLQLAGKLQRSRPFFSHTVKWQSLDRLWGKTFSLNRRHNRHNWPEIFFFSSSFQEKSSHYLWYQIPLCFESRKKLTFVWEEEKLWNLLSRSFFRLFFPIVSNSSERTAQVFPSDNGTERMAMQHSKEWTAQQATCPLCLLTYFFILSHGSILLSFSHNPRRQDSQPKLFCVLFWTPTTFFCRSCCVWYKT